MFALNRKKVVIVGDSMLDRYWYGATKRISPEAPVPVLSVNKMLDKPGGAANVAVNLKALGLQVTLITIVGEDEAGHRLTQQLTDLGIEVCAFASKDYYTTVKFRAIGGHQQLLRADVEMKSPAFIDFDYSACLLSYCKQADFIVFSDYNKGFLLQMPPLIAWCQQQGLPCLIDPKVQDGSVYQGAHYIKPNDRELHALLSFSISDYDGQIKDEYVFALMKKFDWEVLLHTRGEAGLSLYNRSTKSIIHDRPEPQSIYDVSGAGDTVSASFVASLVWEYGDGKQQLQLINYVAGLAIQLPGTSVITMDMIGNYLFERRLHRGMVSLSQLASNKRLLKWANKKVVFTNGCFDLLHPGHLRYLAEARKHGDLLIVGINSDASIRQIKGPGCPVNDCKMRMEMLVTLPYVDCVVPFDAPTPLDLIRLIMPDVLVKGGDYQVEDIVGYDDVIGDGGQVIALPFYKGYSSTAIRERCRFQPEKEA